MTVEAVHNLEEWFQRSLEHAAHAQQVKVEPATEHYMVSLLASFARSENLFEYTEDGWSLRPLALMLAEALESPTLEQRQLTLRRMGDVSLFMTGFFQDHLAHKPVDIDYYSRMGESAYSALSDLPPRSTRDAALLEVYRELAHKFLQCVELLAEVAQKARRYDQRDVMRLYEVYLQTGSERARATLESLGIVPGPHASNRTEH